MPGSALEAYQAALNATPPAPFGRAVQAVEALCGHRDWAQAKDLADLVCTKYPAASRPAGDADGHRLDCCLALIELETGEGSQGAASLRPSSLPKGKAEGAEARGPRRGARTMNEEEDGL
jgi:hypothetical protein